MGQQQSVNIFVIQVPGREEKFRTEKNIWRNSGLPNLVKDTAVQEAQPPQKG